MDLAGSSPPFVDWADLSWQQKTDHCFGLRYPRQNSWNGSFIFQTIKTGLSRFQLFFQQLEPARMGAVTGTDHLNPFQTCPGSKSRRTAVRAGCPGKGRMDMQISDIVHDSFIKQVIIGQSASAQSRVESSPGASQQALWCSWSVITPSIWSQRKGYKVTITSG